MDGTIFLKVCLFDSHSPGSVRLGSQYYHLRGSTLRSSYCSPGRVGSTVHTSLVVHRFIRRTPNFFLRGLSGCNCFHLMGAAFGGTVSYWLLLQRIPDHSKTWLWIPRSTGAD